MWYIDVLKAFGFLPRNQGSTKLKLYDWYQGPDDCALKLNVCPSPDGIGVQYFFFQNLLVEKLLKID